MPILGYEEQIWAGITAATFGASGGVDTSDATGLGSLSITESGVASSPTVTPTGLINSPASLSGAGSVDAPAVGNGTLTLLVSIGSRPSADDIAQAVWSSLVSVLDGDGTFGAQLGKALTVGKFLALK